MEGLKLYRQSHIERIISKRKGEKKLGEQLQFITGLKDLEKHTAKYVLLGIAEDIGVRANYGNPGTYRAWDAMLKSLVNIQVNRYNDPSNIILLGEVDCEEQMEKASYLDESDPNYYVKLGDLVKQVDERVANIIEHIIKAGKIPVIIGGGHNNAFGNIKGASNAIKKPINVLNVDAHTDLRQLEHRHSGNGFSYAIKEGYLKKYSIFGLHSNYTPEYIFREMDNSKNLQFVLIEDLLEKPHDINTRFGQVLSKLDDTKFGFELDCDAIANFPSSAKSPSGFTINQVRHFISEISGNTNCCYFHICEAAPDEENFSQTGKTLTYFITDFLRS